MTPQNAVSAVAQPAGLAPEDAELLAKYADHLQRSPLPGHRALEPRAKLRYLRVVEAWPGARDCAIALLPLYAGTRIAEIRGLDVADVRLSARRGEIHLVGKGEKSRIVAVLMGHASLETTRLDARPSAADMRRAIDLLTADE